MKTYASILLSLLSLLAIETASGETAVVTWDDPTTNEPDVNGISTPIPASGPGSLVSKRIEYGSCNGAAFGTKLGEVIVTSGTTGTVNNLAAATNFCYRVFVKNTYGNESKASNVVAKVTGSPTPMPAVIKNVIAYVLKPGFMGLIRMVKVPGVFLPVGAECDSVLPGLPGYCVIGNYIGRI